MGAECDFIVIRPTDTWPAGFFPPELDGMWIDLATHPTYRELGTNLATAAGRFEVRADGAVAEVWEIKP